MDNNSLFEKNLDTINIEELYKQNGEEKKQAIDTDTTNVEFIRTEPDFNPRLDYFAVDAGGHVYPNLDSIQKALEKEGALLFVYDGSGLPFGYMNVKGQLTKSNDRISSKSQLPGNDFTPMASPLPEDIVAQANANRFNKAKDLAQKAQELVNNAEQTKKDYLTMHNKITERIKKLEDDVRKLNALPKEPVLGDGIEKPVEPVKPVAPVAPIEPKEPKKPEIEEPKPIIINLPKKPVEPGDPPRKPVLPREPQKPAVMVDLEETKDLKPLENVPVFTLKKPVDPGPAPGYSRIVLFFSRLFLRRDSEAYRRRLDYDVRKNAYESDKLNYEQKKTEYEEKLKEFRKENKKIIDKIAARGNTKNYVLAQERYKQDLKDYEQKDKEYQEELKEYEKRVQKYKEELDVYNKAAEEYEKQDLNQDAYNAEFEARQNHYTAVMERYEDELLKFEAQKETFQKNLAKYEKDANEYEQKSRQYEDDLKKYEADLKKYNEALDAYPGGREKYEQDQKAFAEGLKNAGYTVKEYHKIPKELQQRKEQLKNVKTESRRHEKSVKNAKKNLNQLKQNKKDEIYGYGDNLEDILDYRSNLEVKLEGIADLVENNIITRKNLFATTWILKSECEGKSCKDPVAVEKLIKYIACRQAEKEILDITNNYMIANPEAEGACIRNLNNQVMEQRLKNDPLFSLILETQLDKPINPELFAQTYLNPPEVVKARIQVSEAKNSMKEMIGEMEEKFGSKPLDENSFRDYVRWKTFQNVLAGDEDKLVKHVKSARTDFYSNTSVGSADSRLYSEYKKTVQNYKESFTEFYKNQKAKEEATKDLPESTKRLMRLKTNYSLKDMDKAVNTILEHKANAQKENEPKAGDAVKSKGMGGPKK